MPEKKTAAKRTAGSRKTSGAKRTSATKRTSTPPVTTASSPGAAPTQQIAPEAGAPGGVCPRCGTSRYAPEQRTRAEGNRTVRYAILVCERGHTFAKPTAGRLGG